MKYLKTPYQIIAVHYDHDSSRITAFRIRKMETGRMVFVAPMELSRSELINLQHTSIELMAKPQLNSRNAVAVTLVETDGQEYFRMDGKCVAVDNLMTLIHY